MVLRSPRARRRYLARVWAEVVVFALIATALAWVSVALAAMLRLP